MSGKKGINHKIDLVILTKDGILLKSLLFESNVVVTLKSISMKHFFCIALSLTPFMIGLQGQIPTDSLTIWISSQQGITKSVLCSGEGGSIGAEVGCWVDQTQNSFQFRVLGNGNPDLIQYGSDTLNGLPAVSFDGAGGMGTVRRNELNFTSASFFTVAINAKSTPGASVMAIAQPGSWDDEYFFGSQAMVHQTRAANYTSIADENNWGDFPFVITSGKYGSEPSDMSLYVNGLASSNTLSVFGRPSPFTSPDRSAYLAQRGNGSNLSTTKVAEVIVYKNIKINDAWRTVIDNYLSSKYNIGIVPEQDFYHFDTESKGEYDFFVAGIGGQNGGLLSSNSSSGFHISDYSESIDDGDYLFVGHLNQENGMSQHHIPDSVGGRLSRVWALEKTNSVDATILFNYTELDISGSPDLNDEYYLLFSESERPYNFTVVDVNPTVSEEGVSYNVPNDLLFNGYYTLGAVKSFGENPTGLLSPKANYQQAIHLYPNPSTNHLNVSIAGNQIVHPNYFFIRNIRGAVIQEGDLNNLPTVINLANLPNGMYVIQFLTKEGIIFKKFVKQ